jgi:hypothetical protein
MAVGRSAQAMELDRYPGAADAAATAAGADGSGWTLLQLSWVGPRGGKLPQHNTVSPLPSGRS